MQDMSADSAQSYDQLPFRTQPVARSHPDHLATVATLFGLNPPPANHCRVLELGCGTGENLFGMACALPKSEFIGIDLSEVQIAHGKNIIEAVRLENVTLEHMSIMDIEESFGSFDYIIAHGIMSWVPTDVQNKVFEICGTNLSPQGIAYLSYNTYPGWNNRQFIRRVMRQHIKDCKDPHEKVRIGKDIASFFALAIRDKNFFGEQFKTELETIRNLPPWLILHDILEDVNEPFYFEDFISRAQSNNLQYLAEAETASMMLQEFSPEIEQYIDSLSESVIEREQYMDFLRNRTLRRTLLCNNTHSLEHRIDPKRIESLYVASRMAPVDAETQGNASAAGRVFQNPNGGMLQTEDPLTISALEYLHSIWPKAVSYPKLLEVAGVSHNSNTGFFAANLLSAYLGNLIDFHSQEPTYAAHLDSHPHVSSFTRFQAEQGMEITNLKNKTLSLSQFERSVLRLLDGTLDSSQLLEKLSQQEFVNLEISNTDMVSQSVEELSAPLQSTLKKLCSEALLLSTNK